jgi:hypothetical protein
MSMSKLNFSYTYLLTPRSKVLLEKLTVSQLVKKLPAFCETRRSFLAFTSARPPPVPILNQLDLVPNPTSHFLNIHRNIIVPSTSGSPKWFLFLGFPHQNPVYATPSSVRVTCPTHLIEEYRLLSSSLCSFFSIPLLPRPS